MKGLSNILLEGRIEDAREYLETFVAENGYLKTEEDVDEVLGYFVKDDPSGNNKYLMWMAKIYANDSGFSPNMLTDYVQRFHNNLDKIHPALLSNMGFYSASKVATSPKDIESYPDYRTLKRIVDAAEESVTRKQREEEAKAGIEKLYEDNRWLVVKPNTLEASCYYGAGTKWCTTTKDTSHFKDYIAKGPLYYIIDKSRQLGRFYKIAMHVSWDGKEEYYDEQDTLLEKDVLDAVKVLLPKDLQDTIFEDWEGSDEPEPQRFTYAEFAHELRNFVNNLGKSIKLKTKSGVWNLEITVDGQWRWNSPDPRAEVAANPFPDGEPILDIYIETDGDRDVIHDLEVSYSIEELASHNFGPEQYLEKYPDAGNHYGGVERNLKLFLMHVYTPKVREILDSNELSEFIDGDYKTWETQSYVSSYTFEYPPRKGTMTQLFVNYIKQNPESTANDFYMDIYNYPRPRGHNNMFFASIKDSGIVKMERRGRQFVYSLGPNYSSWTKGKLLRTNKKYGDL